MTQLAQAGRRSTVVTSAIIAAAVSALITLSGLLIVAAITAMPPIQIAPTAQMDRANQAWSDRLQGVAALQARERAETAYADRLTGQAVALNQAQLARERAEAAWTLRLTEMAEYHEAQTP